MRVMTKAHSLTTITTRTDANGADDAARWAESRRTGAHTRQLNKQKRPRGADATDGGPRTDASGQTRGTHTPHAATRLTRDHVPIVADCGSRANHLSLAPFVEYWMPSRGAFDVPAAICGKA